MNSYTIHFKSGATIRVKGEQVAVASAADVSNGATVLRSSTNKVVIVNPAEVEFIQQNHDL